MTVMGLVFIVTVLWAPDGLLGLVRRIRIKESGRLRQKGSRRA
jgi:hypothetical protein